MEGVDQNGYDCGDVCEVEGFKALYRVGPQYILI